MTDSTNAKTAGQLCIFCDSPTELLLSNAQKHQKSENYLILVAQNDRAARFGRPERKFGSTFRCDILGD